MIYNYDTNSVFEGPEGVAFIPLVQLSDNKVIAIKVSDVGGGADLVPVYFVEKSA